MSPARRRPATSRPERTAVPQPIGTGIGPLFTTVTGATSDIALVLTMLVLATTFTLVKTALERRVQRWAAGPRPPELAPQASSERTSRLVDLDDSALRTLIADVVDERLDRQRPWLRGPEARKDTLFGGGYSQDRTETLERETGFESCRRRHAASAQCYGRAARRRSVGSAEGRKS
jgi:hypothetical protein